MHRVWELNVSHNIKVYMSFQASIEAVLLYGAEAWSLTKGLEKALDGTYMHPTTKVCPRDQMARSPDQHSSVSKHSVSSRKTMSQEGKVCWSLCPQEQLCPTISSHANYYSCGSPKRRAGSSGM